MGWWTALRDLFEPDGVYCDQVRQFGALDFPEIRPLATLPEIKVLKTAPVPASWTWDKQQRRYVPPVKAKRQKPDNVTPMRQRQNG